MSVNGGVATPGAGESEVLLDINTVLDIAPASKVMVFDGPSSTSYEAMFNAMIGAGVTVISNSWASCEDQVPTATARSIDQVLQNAAAGGITVLNASGDTGSSCLDGSSSTVAVPADSPNGTAVGGTSHVTGPGGTYGSETYWDGSAASPVSGKGGFGLSRNFPRPSYQDGVVTAATRSVPDVAVNADPAHGYLLCQQDAGGCPTGLLYGGTSVAAPTMAGIVAQLNQAEGHNLGNLNPLVYRLANTSAFHSAASMGSDVAHVGLGSPNIDQLSLALRGASVGPVTASTSGVVDSIAARGGRGTQADGLTDDRVVVYLRDTAGNSVSGKTVTIVANAGSHSTVSPASAVTNVDNGAAVFDIIDSTPELVTLTATDTTDNVTLATQATLEFVTPTATGASIIASPPTVPNDGTSKATITVYLENGLGRPAAGKTVSLAENGNAVITPAGSSTPGTTAVTDASGNATFSATDTVAQTVSFTATDVTDGNLPVPGNATVNFNPSTATCPTALPTPASGFSVSRFATGFTITTNSQFLPGNFTLGPCQGESAPAFDASGNAYITDSADGSIHVIGPSGGVASPANQLPDARFEPFSLGSLAFGPDGSLYAGLIVTNANVRAPEIVQVNPATGATIRVVASAATGLPDCPFLLAVDPLSGDLFATDECTGFAASDQITRIHNPSGLAPTTSDYANVSGDLPITFGPDGTLYTSAFSGGVTSIVSIGGTNTTPTVTPLVTIPGPGYPFGLAVGSVGPSGKAATLSLSEINGPELSIDLTRNPATLTTMASGPDGGNGVELGATSAGGCLYVPLVGTVVRIGPSLCGSAPTTTGPQLALAGTGLNRPSTGSPVTFTATLANVAAPTGTPIEFVVSGANSQVKLVNADANGNAVFTYSGVFPGTDTVTAFAIINGNTVTSAPLSFRWVAGKDTSFLSLNQSQGGGPVAKPAKLTANLVDITQSPPAPIPNAPITISLDGQSCAATTDGSGNGTCMITPTGPPGLVPVTASYAGTTLYTPATATDSFAVSANVAGQPPAITSAASTTFAVGAAGSFTVVATGSPAPTLAESGTLPSGVTFDPATGVLGGTPAAGTVGSYPITFTATNGIAPDATQAFALRVVKANTTTTLVASPPNPGFGTPITFTASVMPTAANTLSPTGTVSFFVDGRPNAVATVALVGGQASVTTSALGAGRHRVRATYNGDANFAASTSTTPITATIGCTNTITGDHPGSLVVSSGIVCVVGATIGGSVIVAKGASIDIEGSTIGGGISADGGAGTIRICGTNTKGTVSVQRMAGLVIIGDPGDAACTPNRIGGSLILQDNTGGVEAINNTVARLVASNNNGPGPYPGDVTTISGNHT
ncbi:MAG: Ig-like domain repeat protein [Actinomycetota bacterium]|nr:Ig-like domain repeat protein [Actinomycetota bacterium]